MANYLSILRGINVSGQKRVPMVELKAVYEQLNFKNITTYIQSGNVTFDSANAKDLSKKIEKKISEKFNFDVPVIIRTIDELEHTIKSNPFRKDKKNDVERLYVTYLAETPTQENINKLNTYDYSPEQFFLLGKEVYLFCPLGYGNSKLSNNFFENKLKVIATTRNWRTTNELLKIMKAG